MALVRIAVMAMVACSFAAAGDFGIDIGSPAATTTAVKIKRVNFSVRTHDCPGEAKLTGTAKYVNGTDHPLSLIVGTTPGTFAVVRGSEEALVAVITADCAGTKAGAIVPVNAQGLYDREAAKFFSHAPTAAEVDEALKKLQGGSR